MSNKLLQEKMLGDYPGLMRTVQLIDDFIEIEFNFQYSNEVGIRFRNHYFDPKIENDFLSNYYKTGGSTNDDVVDIKTIYSSWARLIKDILDGLNLLPLNNNSYTCDFDDNSLRKKMEYTVSKKCVVPLCVSIKKCLFNSVDDSGTY